jgi:hypothetical protein
MTEENKTTKDNRSFGRKLLGMGLGAILVIAIPVSQFLDCDGASPAPQEARERSFEKGKYVGEPIAPWMRMSENLRYLPTSVVNNLKRPGKGTLELIDEPLFMRPERFGMLPDPDGSYLPLGVTSSPMIEDVYVPMVGLTCSACHVGAISNGEKWITVPGAPNLMTVNVFFGEMIKSLIATLANPKAFEELWLAHAKDSGLSSRNTGEEPNLLSETQANRLSQGDVSTVNVDEFVDAYPTIDHLDSRGEFAAYLTSRVAQLIGRASGSSDSPEFPMGTSNPWVTTRALFGTQFVGLDSDDIVPIGGPITAPDIFHYRERKWVFWSQVTNSMLERNIAQGMALLGDVDWETHAVTIDVTALGVIQDANETIAPPIWPADLLGEVDLVKANRGCYTYKRQCSSCHSYDHGDDRGSLAFRMYDVGTDATYCQGVNATTEGYDSVPDLVAPVTQLVKAKALGHSGHTEFEEGRLPVVWRGMTCNELPARPLEGIWSTAPFLHNGSVKSIDELLKRSIDRSVTFRIGSVEYDPNVLGFKEASLPHTSLVDTRVNGMRNTGHEFTVIDDRERADLIEYLKVHLNDKECQ